MVVELDVIEEVVAEVVVVVEGVVKSEEKRKSVSGGK